MLKTMGVGTVVVWAVPTVVSINSVAAAASAPGPGPGNCTEFVCGGPFCSTDCLNVTGDNIAACFQRADGLPGICAPDFHCSNPTCTTNAECGAGEACFINTCCGAEGHCAPVACLSPTAAPFGKSTGRTAAVPAPVG
jgi:hypothetical protein